MTQTFESVILNIHSKNYLPCRTGFDRFLFGGIKPTAKQPTDIIAVLSDKMLCYVGTIGRMAAGSGAENVCVIDAEEILF